MTTMRLLPEAEEELRETAAFYEAQQPGLGLSLLQEVRRSIRLIAVHPLTARVLRADVRVRTLARFPYRIYYCARPEEILIIAIGHLRRRPGYWRTRS